MLFYPLDIYIKTIPGNMRKAIAIDSVLYCCGPVEGGGLLLTPNEDGHNST